MLSCFHICLPGTESFLCREAVLYGMEILERGDGWVQSSMPENGLFLEAGLCYPICTVLDGRSLVDASVNDIADTCVAAVGDAFLDCQLTDEWPVLCETFSPDASGRLTSVRKEFQRRLRRRMSRVSRLARLDYPHQEGHHRGMVIAALGKNRFIIGTEFHYWGQRRMKQDPDAPSRSYLKIEEAFRVFGDVPSKGDMVVDLGAAPGGWSYSAASHGADVWAVDNGPLKGGAAKHPRIEHVREDAFLYAPPGMAAERRWLLCDMIEDPYRVIGDILLPWIDRGQCECFVVNLKVGKRDPIELLRKLLVGDDALLANRCRWVKVRRLYHDREEITCMGQVQ